MDTIQKNLDNKLNEQKQRYIDELQIIEELGKQYNFNNWMKARKKYLIDKLK